MTQETEKTRKIESKRESEKVVREEERGKEEESRENAATSLLVTHGDPETQRGKGEKVNFDTERHIETGREE